MAGNLVLLGPDSDEVDVIRRMAPEGVDVEWVDLTRPVEEQAAQLEEAVAIIPLAGRVPLEIARRCPNLRLVQTVSAGTDTLDVKGLGEMGIRTANNGGGNAVAVAEHAIALIISVYRKLRLQLESVQAREWAGDIREAWRGQVHELTGKTVGIVGPGPHRSSRGPAPSGLGVRAGLLRRGGALRRDGAGVGYPPRLPGRAAAGV